MTNLKHSSLHVHYARQPSEKALAHLKSLLAETIDLTLGADLPDPADYHILVEGVPAREFVAEAPQLESIIIPWAGLPVSTRELMLKFPQISVHNLHHNAGATAEMSLALLFAAAKFVVPMDQTMRSGNWTPRYEANPSISLEGKTALILGYGSIGRHVGRVLNAMGMRVIGIRRTPQPDDIVEVFGINDLHRLLPETDVLMVTAPGTPDTNGLIGEQELGLMPKGGILTNVGRGPIVDQKALYKALKSRHLHAGGMDVWYNYPSDEESRSNTPPADYPFHELDNFVMSPHRGGGTRETELIRMAALAAALNSVAQGKPLPNKVNLQAGY
jgi:phosphoglycerate dehydrogenase-like enzyme